jgi:hypothetical protein
MLVQSTFTIETGNQSSLPLNGEWKLVLTAD